MVTLIVFRGVQGLAAGSIMPTTNTIVADLYGPASGEGPGLPSERLGRLRGRRADVGGLFAQYWTWRGIFWLNLPLGIGAAWMLQRHLHEHVERREHQIDYAGAAR